MKNFFKIILFAAVICNISSVASAADYTHGDACTTAGAFHITNDPSSVDFLVCNGSNWQTAHSAPIAGNIFRLDNNPALGNSGCLRYDGTAGRIQFSHDCSIYENFATTIWSLGAGDDIYYDATTPEVGIGNTSPAFTLDVTGAIRAADYIVIDSSAGASTPNYFDLDDLASVVLTAPANTEVLTFNGTNWVNAAGGGGGGAINDLSDATTDYVTNNNFFMGQNAGASIAASGQSNLAIGQNALSAQTTADNSLAIGYNALAANTKENAIAIGYNAAAVLAGGNNFQPFMAIGTNAAENATSAADSIMVLGNQAARTTTSLCNSAMIIGHQAANQTPGCLDFSTIVGNASAFNAQELTGSVLLGASVAQGSSGSANDLIINSVLIGTEVARDFTDNIRDSVMIGRSAGRNVTESNRNVIIGMESAATLTTGDSNIIIGYQADVSAAGASNELNIGNTIYGNLTNDAVAIGSTASATGPNSFALGPSATATSSYSFAVGDNASATGLNAVALGSYSLASGSDSITLTGDGNAAGGHSISAGRQSYARGYHSLALGNRVSVGSGAQATDANSNVGNYSIGFGLGNPSLGNNPNVASDQTAAFFFGDQDNSGVSNENSLALVGGKLLIDGVSGGVDTEYGCIRYEDTANQLQFSNDCEAVTPTYTALGGGGGVLNDLGDVFHDPITDFSNGDLDFWGGNDDDDNLFMGHLGASLTGTADPNKGAGNTGIGATALDALTEGDANIAIGMDALTSLTVGAFNTAIGFAAGASLNDDPDSNGNTFIGAEAGKRVTAGLMNTFIGSGVAAEYDTYHYGATALGHGSLINYNQPVATTSNTNTAVGFLSLNKVESGRGNTALGAYTAGRFGGPAIGAIERNTLIGQGAGANFDGSVSPVSNNVLVGFDAGANVASGDNNLFLGYRAGDLTTSGSDNILIGYDVDASSATAANELNIGNLIYGDLANNEVFLDAPAAAAPDGDLANGQVTFWLDAANDEIELKARDSAGDIINATIGGGGGGGAINDLSDATTDYVTDNNFFMGQNAGSSILPGTDRNLAIGEDALSSATTGWGNIAMGFEALRDNDSGIINLGIGPYALERNTTGNINTALGYHALQANNGNENTAIGYQASYRNSSGGNNVAIGNYSLYHQRSGRDNIAIGLFAGFGPGDASWSRSIFIGSNAGRNVDNNANNNIFIGHQTGDLTTTGSDNILIGYDVDASSATAANELNIGNTIFGDLTTGYVGIGDTTPDVALDVVGDINYTGVIVDVSDIRMKYDIEPLESPLRKLSSLNGFSFKMKNDEAKKIEYGVSAQEVQKVFPELVHQVDEDGTLGVSYNGLIAPMIEAIKEQQKQIESLKSEIETLKAQQKANQNHEAL